MLNVNKINQMCMDLAFAVMVAAGLACAWGLGVEGAVLAFGSCLGAIAFFRVVLR